MRQNRNRNQNQGRYEYEIVAGVNLQPRSAAGGGDIERGDGIYDEAPFFVGEPADENHEGEIRQQERSDSAIEKEAEARERERREQQLREVGGHVCVERLYL